MRANSLMRDCGTNGLEELDCFTARATALSGPTTRQPCSSNVALHIYAEQRIVLDYQYAPFGEGQIFVGHTRTIFRVSKNNTSRRSPTPRRVTERLVRAG